MAVKITGTGVSYGDPKYDQYTNQTADTTIQPNTNAIVKIKFAYLTTRDQSGSGDGASVVIDGSQIDMGVPQKSTNWYKLEVMTIIDDSGAAIDGFGFEFQRYTTSAGWQAIMGTGSHWDYNNNVSDYYRAPHMFCYVPVHPTYPTQGHQFRVVARLHDSGGTRWNASIGAQTRSGGWENGIFEVFEIDSSAVTTSFTRNY
jgi:hypothetical protein